MKMDLKTVRALRKRLEVIGRERSDLAARQKALNKESEALCTLVEQYCQGFPAEPVRLRRPDAIRAALRELGQASPKEVSERMTENGWDWNGVDPIQTVGVELNRFSRIDGGDVRRIERGIYQFEEI